MSLDLAFQNLPSIETARLILRSPNAEDAESFYHHFATIKTSRFWDSEHKNLEKAEEHLREVAENYKKKHGLWWAVTLKGKDELIGSVSLRDIREESIAELGYWLSAEYQRKGIASEAVQAVVRFGLDELRLLRIQATSHPENVGSIRVLENAGFEQEGVLRKFIRFKEGWGDCLMFSVLSVP